MNTPRSFIMFTLIYFQHTYKSIGSEQKEVSVKAQKIGAATSPTKSKQFIETFNFRAF